MRNSTSRAVQRVAHAAQVPVREQRVFGKARPLQSRAVMKNALFFGVFLQVVACASESPSAVGGESGLSRSKTIASLSGEEASSLCDWSLRTQGGAGKVTKCSQTSSQVVHTKDECLEDIEAIKTLASCYALTVGEVEDCSKEEGADACEPSPACDASNARLETCAGKD